MTTATEGGMPAVVVYKCHYSSFLGLYEAQAWTTWGTIITSHCSSTKDHARKDIQRPSHVEAIRRKFPDGYTQRWEF